MCGGLWFCRLGISACLTPSSVAQDASRGRLTAVKWCHDMARTHAWPLRCEPPRAAPRHSFPRSPCASKMSRWWAPLRVKATSRARCSRNVDARPPHTADGRNRRGGNGAPTILRRPGTHAAVSPPSGPDKVRSGPGGPGGLGPEA
jgi:hypothetical protein